jgi:putative DNA primase/helicase
MATVRILPKTDERPIINSTTEIADMVDLAISALSADDAVYQRDGRLVHVVRVTESDADDLAIVGTPQIRVMLPATLRERLSRAARWTKFDGRSRKWVPALPPEPVVHAAVARGEYPGIRPLVGVIEAPSMRPDGSVIQATGYDRATGYLYAPSGEFPVVPESPTQEDAARALADLEEPFAEFPFASPEHRASAIAAILTIMARPAIRGSTPAILHDANTRGSGKTLKADAIATIATGRETAKMQYPKDEEELEKVLAAYALRGAALVNFDNVTRLFGGGPLDRCLTAGDLVELRILGKTEVPAMRWRAVVMATGNNISLSGDTSRRVMISRLESALENPEERQNFKHHPLLEWVRAERPRLVVAALTILRAWHVAGRPPGDCKSWGSFEAWSAIVPPAIVFAGGADPMQTRPAVTGEEDSEKRALVAVLDGLARLDPNGSGIAARTVIDSLYPVERLRGHAAPDGYDGTREAIDSLTSTQPGKAPSTSRLGYALRRFKRRVVGGRMLDCNVDRTGVARWRVEGQATGAGDAGLEGDVPAPRVRDACISGGNGENIPSDTPLPPQGEFGEWLEGEGIGGDE